MANNPIHMPPQDHLINGALFEYPTDAPTLIILPPYCLPIDEDPVLPFYIDHDGDFLCTPAHFFSPELPSGLQSHYPLPLYFTGLAEGDVYVSYFEHKTHKLFIQLIQIRHTCPTASKF